MEEAIGDRKATPPLVSDTTKPMKLEELKDFEGKSDSKESLDKESVDTSTNRDNEENSSQDYDLSVLCSPPSPRPLLAKSYKKRRKREIDYADLTKKVKKELRESSRALEAKIEDLYKKKLVVLEHDLRIKRENEYKHKVHENITKTTMQIAQLYNWPEEKVKKALEENFNKVYGG
ncbi:hypothetical protein PHYBLDRAFT_145632 [Phycomyces blakesleeanus NRRL 1555(-)]|uniref:Uncharacterized protein n=1 Tax=Phycomyces blakesleeanus (strain ATCC 8743b / DSM 1359 / FGSC 10004 / NBRC 33097 / NRRL 1555) TaxID=763407 RepID=A0A167MLX6_PHYB8|nr:hypothetical protein PHYBLDRAFT_145632 [Phycomyces blakesleeanus NRRL 1555(-)]OAD73229.1 hypothetical protein PHYBLDRAFT_145632 [Phycomyces blakesleeanus NRRL 1555(-)]|eukprot:XP_018291269.1 hypothetical protein PHYBLDRAFT_145632 [Phycomyces blakesleeanus NRRL 1555(-)]